MTIAHDFKVDDVIAVSECCDDHVSGTDELIGVSDCRDNQIIGVGDFRDDEIIGASV